MASEPLSEPLETELTRLWDTWPHVSLYPVPKILWLRGMRAFARMAVEEQPKGEPWAYAVKCPPGEEFDYLMFPDSDSAHCEVDYRNSNLEEGQDEIPAPIPLYPRLETAGAHKVHIVDMANE